MKDILNKEYVTESPRKQLAEQGIEVFIQQSEQPMLVAHPHIHSALEFIYILKGKYKVYANDNEFDMSDGDLCFFRSGTIHRTYSLDRNGGSYFVMKIEPSIILNLANSEYGISYIMQFLLYGDDAKVLWTKEELSEGEIGRSVRGILEEHISENFGKELSIKIHASKLLLEILRQENTGGGSFDVFSSDVSLTKQIYKAIVFINRNYGKDISALECAEHINMSYSYFSRSFKRITGKSFKEYLNQIRINQAEKLLLSTDQSVTEVCFSCGYNNVSYFISQYKQLRGKTPHNFRNGV